MKIIKTIFGSLLILSFLQNILSETKQSGLENLASVISLILGVLLIVLSYSKNIYAIKRSNTIFIILVTFIALIFCYLTLIYMLNKY